MKAVADTLAVARLNLIEHVSRMAKKTGLRFVLIALSAVALKSCHSRSSPRALGRYFRSRRAGVPCPPPSRYGRD